MTKPTRDNPYGPRAFQPLDFVFRRWALIVTPAIVAAVLALVLSAGGEEQYEAKAKLLVGGPSIAEAAFFKRDFPAQPISRDPVVNLELGELTVIGDAAAEELGNGLTGEDVSGAVSVAAEGSSNIVNVTAIESEPQVATDVANAFADAYVEFLRDSDRERIDRVMEQVQNDLGSLDPTDASGEAGATLRAQLARLVGLRALQTGNAEVVETAVEPTASNAASPLRNGALGGFLGLLVGVGLALLLDRLDRRLRNSAELAEMFDDVPLLIDIPVDGKAPTVQGGQADLTTEAFRLLRTRLKFSAATEGEGLGTLLVTTPSSGDDGARVATRFAVACAEAGDRALLVDADLRRSSVATEAGLAPSPGLSQVLAGEAELVDVVQHFSLPGGAEATELLLDVIAGGQPHPNPAELLGRPQLAAVLEQAHRDYDVVVIHGLPMTEVADSVPLVSQVDGVIVVARIGGASTEVVSRLRDQLQGLGARVVGVIAADVPGRRGFLG